MLINSRQSSLLVVDIQQKLLPAIDGGAKVLENACWLVDVAREVGVPVMVSEQYPQGIGPTEPALAARLHPGEIGGKTHFSALGEPCIDVLAGFDRPQVVMAGMEAHVCVLQTALDLHAAGKQVFVVDEAVGSRRPADKALALERMRRAGVIIVSREMVAFEWLRMSGTELFRKISKTFIR